MHTVAVYDTNILFSATGWRGTPYDCLELARQGRVEGVTCLEILGELADTSRCNFVIHPPIIQNL